MNSLLKREGGENRPREEIINLIQLVQCLSLFDLWLQ